MVSYMMVCIPKTGVARYTATIEVAKRAGKNLLRVQIVYEHCSSHDKNHWTAKTILLF